jgi:hypothetical protein
MSAGLHTIKVIDDANENKEIKRHGEIKLGQRGGNTIISGKVQKLNLAMP